MNDNHCPFQKFRFSSSKAGLNKKLKKEDGFPQIETLLLFLISNVTKSDKCGRNSTVSLLCGAERVSSGEGAAEERG